MNGSADALDIAEFDWRWGPRYVRSGATGQMLRAFEAALGKHLEGAPQGGGEWGWKHPQSYLLLPFLAERFPGLRFIQVVRDGRDIALSRNENQVRLYGDQALGPGDPTDPVRKIRFWAWANDRASDHCATLLRGRALCVRLKDLCLEPEAETRRVLEFVDAPGTEPLPIDEISVPDSLGRGRSADPDLVRRLEGAAGGTLRRLGYL